MLKQNAERWQDNNMTRNVTDNINGYLGNLLDDKKNIFFIIYLSVLKYFAIKTI